MSYVRQFLADVLYVAGFALYRLFATIVNFEFFATALHRVRWVYWIRNLATWFCRQSFRLAP